MNPNVAIVILLMIFAVLIVAKCPITFSMIIATAFPLR